MSPSNCWSNARVQIPCTVLPGYRCVCRVSSMTSCPPCDRWVCRCFSLQILVRGLMYSCCIDMSVEGMLRKNGNIRRLKELTDAIDRDPSSVDLTQDNAVQLAALLKKFLRELPEPLLTFKLHRLLVASQCTCFCLIAHLPEADGKSHSTSKRRRKTADAPHVIPAAPKVS